MAVDDMVIFGNIAMDGVDIPEIFGHWVLDTHGGGWIPAIFTYVLTQWDLKLTLYFALNLPAITIGGIDNQNSALKEGNVKLPSFA